MSLQRDGENVSFDELIQARTTVPLAAVAEDEGFWARVAGSYDRSPAFTQLDYGYYHPSLRAVLEVELSTAREINRRGSHFKRLESTSLLESARTELARMAGVSPDELAITRNATEALNIIIKGLPLAPGDEVVGSDQDYPSMDEAWEQRSREDGIIFRRVAIPLHPSSDDEIVARFSEAITPRTRVLHLTHLIHLTGHVLPVRKLCALGRSRGLDVIVDAAHSFAHINFEIAELDCDYLGASLHKWLGAPLGLGMLYVRRTKVAGLRPLFGDVRLASDDVRRLEHFGNRPDSLFAGLREAIRWHQAFGTELKHARLSYLQRSWTERVGDLPHVRLLTPGEATRHGAIGTFAVEGRTPAEIADDLLRNHELFVCAREHPIASGVRITPGLPTSRADMDRLVDALAKMKR